jgi:hypothetical protein
MISGTLIRPALLWVKASDLRPWSLPYVFLALSFSLGLFAYSFVCMVPGTICYLPEKERIVGTRHVPPTVAHEGIRSNSVLVFPCLLG